MNFANYKYSSKETDPTGMIIFTLSPAILNRYACLAIEGSSPDKKYFDYDEENHRCKLLSPVDATDE